MTSVESAAIRASRLAEIEEPNFWKQTAMLVKEARNRGDREAQELWGYITQDNFEVAQILLSDEKYQEMNRLKILCFPISSVSSFFDQHCSLFPEIRFFNFC